MSEGLLALLLLTGSPPSWVFMVLAGIAGAGQALFNPDLTGSSPRSTPSPSPRSSSSAPSSPATISAAPPPGAILATYGAGSIAGALAALRFRPRRPLVAATLGTAVFALPLGLIALPAGTMAIAAAAGAAGFGVSIFATLYDWFGSVAFVPLGYLLAAPLASALGDRGGPAPRRGRGDRLLRGGAS